jgi:HTH-type transcriptional regulator / antitoxin HigA
MDAPDPIEAIKFRLEQQGKDKKALVGVVGNRTRVSVAERSTAANGCAGGH